MASTPAFVGDYDNDRALLLSTHSTRPRIGLEAGASGTRVHAIQAVSTDTADNTIKTYLCKEMTLQSDMTVGAHVDGGGGSDTLTRTGGSFITDGWKIGDYLLVHGSTTLANDYLVQLTAVAALTLTFATGTVNTAENLPSGAKLFRATLQETLSIPDLSGTNGTDPAVDVLNGLIGVSDTIENAFITLGPDWALAFAAGTALGASEYIAVTSYFGNY